LSDSKTMRFKSLPPVSCRLISPVALFAVFFAAFCAMAQSAPVSEDKPWVPSRNPLTQHAAGQAKSEYVIDSNAVYTLAELIDLAEEHNPETRAAWHNAKAEAASLGIAKSALYPTIAAVALAATTRAGALIGEGFHKQTEGYFYPDLTIDYLLFDFGERHATIAAARANLIAANFAFNDAHRRIIAQVMSSYYRLLYTMGQEDAARADLTNAQAVQKDAEQRLANGLATLPDVLEAKAATAQADFDLQAVIGAEEIAYGDLSTTLALPADSQYHVQGIQDITIPEAMSEPADEAIDRALDQRPDLLEQVARLRAAEADVTRARSAYFPTLSFAGTGGVVRAYGQQDLYPGSYAEAPSWDFQLSLRWTVFDGLRRERAVSQAAERRQQTQAEIDGLRDQISDEVWAAYSNTKTALRQRKAAAALLEASSESYTAALKAYNFGVRSLLDVVAAQKALAQARTADISARTQVLTQTATLAFRTGDLLRMRPVKTTP